MAAPTFVAEHETTWNSETPNPRVTAAFNALAGDLLVCIGMSEDQAYPLATPTNTQGALTWTLRQSIVVSSYSTCYVWTAPVDANKTGMTVSVSRTSNGFHGLNVLQFRDHGGVGASAKANASGAPAVNLTTTAADSAVVVAVADWNAASGASRTWRTVGVAATEQSYEANGHYTLYIARHSNAGAAGAKTAGLSAPAGQKYSIIAVEVLGTASEEVPTGSASSTITISGAATGTTTRTGAASGPLTISGAAAGATSRTGIASGTLTIDGSAAATATRTGASTGTVALSGTATGTSARLGTANAGTSITSTAAGLSSRSGQAATTVDLSGTALGVTIRTGAASSLITITGTATTGEGVADVRDLIITALGPPGTGWAATPITGPTLTISPVTEGWATTRPANAATTTPAVNTSTLATGTPATAGTTQPPAVATTTTSPTT